MLQRNRTNQILTISFFMFSIVLIPVITNGKEMVNLPDTQIDAKAMSAEKFESWLEAQLLRTKINREVLTYSETSVFQRMRSGVPITDKSILILVFAWASYEQNSDEQRSETTELAFFNSRHIIEKILPYLKGRISLQKSLYEWKDYLFSKEGDVNSAIANYRRAKVLFYDPTNEISLDEWHVESILDWANLLYQDLKIKDESEKLYMQIIHYPLAKFTHPRAFLFYKRAYINAGKKLILLRQGNLKALQSTYFLDMSKSELMPVLKQAIIEAGGNPIGIQRNNFYPPNVENIVMQVSGLGPSIGELDGQDQSKQSSDEGISIAKQFMIDVPDYNRTKKDKIEQATNKLIIQQSEIVALVISQLKGGELSQAAKAEAITLLGKLHAEKAIDILVENINFFDDRSYAKPVTHLPKIRGYVARAALVTIGKHASETILDVISTNPSEVSKSLQTFDEPKIDGYVEVLTQIEGTDYALLKLQDRAKIAKDPIVRKQLQMVMDRLKALLSAK